MRKYAEDRKEILKEIMDFLQKKIWEYIEKYEMFIPGDKVVIGLSGGADSVCLFFVMLWLREKMGIEIICVHVHHGIRGEEADGDREFVEQLCKEYNVIEKTFCYNVKRMAREKKQSEEEMGRNLRYESFRKVMKEFAYNKIAVAHNLGDQAETILHHLCRGTGLDGLAGIEPVIGEIVRPLLGVRKQEIEDWLTKKEITWRVDSTNLTEDYMRNRIRREVLPMLEEKVNKETIAHIAACGETVLEVKLYIKKKGKEVYDRIRREKEGRICIEEEAWKKEDIVIQKQICFLIVEELGRGRRNITAKHIEGILELMKKEVGKKLDLPGGILAERLYNGLTFGIKKEKKEKIEIEVEVNIKDRGEYKIFFEKKEWKFIAEEAIEKEKIELEEIKKIAENTYTKWFDYDKIKNTLLLRNRKEGDYIELGGGLGRKKLKKFFIDEKIPQEKRDSILLLADGSHILWIIGYQISNKVKITDSTKRVIRVHLDGGNKSGREN